LLSAFPFYLLLLPFWRIKIYIKITADYCAMRGLEALTLSVKISQPSCKRSVTYYHRVLTWGIKVPCEGWLTGVYR